MGILHKKREGKSLETFRIRWNDLERDKKEGQGETFKGTRGKK